MKIEERVVKEEFMRLFGDRHGVDRSLFERIRELG